MTSLIANVAIFDGTTGDPVFVENTTARIFSASGAITFEYFLDFAFDLSARFASPGEQFIIFETPITESLLSVFSLQFGSSSATYLTLVDATTNVEYLFQLGSDGSGIPDFPTSTRSFDHLVESATNAGQVPFGEDNDFSVPLANWLGRGLTENDFVNLSARDTSENIDLGIGNDTFYGGGGFDIAFGGAGNDRLVAGRNDSDFDNGAEFYGGAGSDVLKAKGAFSVSFYGEAGNDRLIGSAGDDWLDGSFNDDTLIGLGGEDQLHGGNQDDALYGGRDNDLLFAGDGNDLLRGNRGNDGLNGEAGDDDLRGGGQQDELNGGTGNDYLLGGNGLDRLIGGEDDDVLVGGFGVGVNDGLRDTFVFDPAGGFDRVKDFEDGIDVIDLIAFGFLEFDAVSSLAADTAAGLRLRFESGNVLFLEGFSKSDFDASDVVL